MQIEYREVGIEAANEIAQVNSDTLRECGLAAADIYCVERLRRRWKGYGLRLQHPQKALEPRILFGAFEDGGMVGYIAGHFSTRHGLEGELQSIYVLPKYQRQGIGSELMNRLANWFAAQGRQSVCVGIEPANPFRRFYEKHGARYLNEHWLVWDDIGAVADESYRAARS